MGNEEKRLGTDGIYQGWRTYGTPQVFSGTPLDTLNQGYSTTMIKIGPPGKLHYLQRSRKKRNHTAAWLIPAKKNYSSRLAE